MTNALATAPLPHACVVHLGFAGAHDLFPGIGDPQRRAKFTDELTRQVTDRLRQLRAHPRLPLHDGHFFVGVMQPGSGGEGVLADACDDVGIALRLFLPQTRDEFLAAKDPRPPFTDDFTAAQREKILQRLQRASILQERVVSTASERAARFAETSAHILQLADVAVILQPKHRDGIGKPGRTNAFAEQALRSGKPLYALTFWIDENQKLHVYDELRYPRDLIWQPPRLPDVIPEPVLAAADMAQRVDAECGRQAQTCRAECTRASQAAVRNHIVLIGVASAVLLLLGMFRDSITESFGWLLALAAFSVLVPGALTLQRAVTAAASVVATRQRWTDLQLAADIARSVQTFSPAAAGIDAARAVFPGQPHDFEFLFAAPLPADVRALAQTLAVEHLRRLRGVRSLVWEDLRSRYLRERLEPSIAAYRAKLDEVRKHIGRVGRQLAALGAAIAVLLAVALMLPTSANPIVTTLAVLALLAPVSALALHAHGCFVRHRLRAAACVDLLDRLGSRSQHIERAPNEYAFLQRQADAETQLLAAALDGYRWRRRDL